MGSRIHPSVLQFATAVLRKGQGSDGKVFKVNTRVLHLQFSVTDLGSPADGCELFMSGFWDECNRVYLFPSLGNIVSCRRI